MTALKSGRLMVSGSGPAGMIAALALARAGHDVVLTGPVSSDDDRRTTALMMPAIKYLESLSVWQTIASKTAPLSSMRIIDGTKRLIRSPAVTFRAAEIGYDAFGYNIPNLVLNSALNQAVSDHPRIIRNTSAVNDYAFNGDHITATMADGQVIDTQIVIAADGRNSLARNSAGIKTKNWSYPQTAVVFSFSHTLSHENISTEFHTEEGPFTQVPLPGNRSSLVWVANPVRAEQLMKMDPQQLARAAEDKMQSMLGAITIDTPQQAWPLTGLVPHSFAAKRTILIGEAAHVFPPIGAQGLNLGIRDVEMLLPAIAQGLGDAGSDQVMRAYDRSRRPDILARTRSVDTLNRTLLSNALPAQIMRSAGLEILRNFPPLRAFFMREGLRPGSGFSQLGKVFNRVDNH